MADPRFFKSQGPFSVGEIAKAAGCEVPTTVGPDVKFDDIMPLQDAGPSHVSFLDNPRYQEAFANTNAGLCLVSERYVSLAPEETIILVTDYPYHAYARVAAMFYPANLATGKRANSASIDPNASVSPSADVSEGAVVLAGANIGENCIVGANAVIGEGVTVGSGTVIGPGATVSHSDIGENSIIHSGVRIGQDGFGFALGPSGHIKVPQLGRVIVGSNVEIGANTTIDRGTGPDTVIGNGTKIDNLVQIAHNVVIGENCVIVSQTGVSGSTELGDFVVLAGQVGVAGHLSIGSGARIAAQSGVMKDVPPGREQGGSPAKPVRQWLREVATVERMAKKKGG